MRSAGRQLGSGAQMSPKTRLQHMEREGSYTDKEQHAAGPFLSCLPIHFCFHPLPPAPAAKPRLTTPNHHHRQPTAAGSAPRPAPSWSSWEQQTGHVRWHRQHRRGRRCGRRGEGGRAPVSIRISCSLHNRRAIVQRQHHRVLPNGPLPASLASPLQPTSQWPSSTACAPPWTQSG